MLRKMLASILLTGSLLLAGCGTDIQALGGGAIPHYEEPDPVVFSAEETQTLTQFAKDHSVLFKKIQGQAHAYRAIVRSHNKWALKTNRKRLEVLGFSDEDLRELVREDGD